MAHIMVTEYGMYDEIGPVYLGGGNEIFLGRDFSAQNQFQTPGKPRWTTPCMK